MEYCKQLEKAKYYDMNKFHEYKFEKETKPKNRILL